MYGVFSGSGREGASDSCSHRVTEQGTCTGNIHTVQDFIHFNWHREPMEGRWSADKSHGNCAPNWANSVLCWWITKGTKCGEKVAIKNHIRV